MRLLVALFAIAVGLLCPAGAGADVYDDFRRDGRINPCNYTDGQLRNGLNGLPPDIKQYAPGLADQLAAGREGCGVGGGPGATDTREFEQVVAAGPTEPPKADIPSPPTPKPRARLRLADLATPGISAAPTGSDAPGWLLPVLLLVLAGVGLGALARLRGASGERLLRPLGAAFEEAGGRTADALATLRDTLRTGRS